MNENHAETLDCQESFCQTIPFDLRKKRQLHCFHSYPYKRVPHKADSSCFKKLQGRWEQDTGHRLGCSSRCFHIFTSAPHSQWDFSAQLIKCLPFCFFSSYRTLLFPSHIFSFTSKVRKAWTNHSLEV